MKLFTILCAALSATVAVAKAGQYADLTASTLFTLIPECSIPCKVNTLSTDGCELNDFACHCSKWDYIQQNTQPCLLSNSTCKLTELYDFVSVMTDICIYFKYSSPLHENARRTYSNTSSSTTAIFTTTTTTTNTSTSTSTTTPPTIQTSIVTSTTTPAVAYNYTPSITAYKTATQTAPITQYTGGAVAVGSSALGLVGVLVAGLMM